MDSMKHRRLQELDRSDFEIVDGEPDIRGWDVKNSSGQKIGEVEELIVDAQRKKVRYMVVDLDDNELKLDHRKVLVPIGLAELDKNDDDVILPQIQVQQLSALPDYDKDHLDEEVEQRVCDVFGRRNNAMNSTAGSVGSEEFYQQDYFNDDNLYKNRMHQSRPAQQPNQPSEYERGLRLWEQRSEGGIIPGSGNEDPYRKRTVEEEARMETVRNRRTTYEQRRYGGTRERGGYNDDHSQRKDNSFERRIRDEGLQDA